MDEKLTKNGLNSTRIFLNETKILKGFIQGKSAKIGNLFYKRHLTFFFKTWE